VPPSRLNPTDAALWDIERNPTLRTTIVGVLMLDRPVDPARLRDVIEVATRRIPRLRQRVVAHTAGVGTPHWELVADFDLDDHVRVVSAPAGVDDAAVAAVAASLASDPFRRDRPLWELVYLDPPAGRSAAILKVHHSLTDGVGGIGLLDVMLDRDRGAPHADPDTVPLPVPGRRPAPTDEERGERVRRVVDLPWDAASAATTAVFHPVRTASGSWEAVRSAGRLLAPSAAPLSPLLTGRGMERSASMAHVDLVRLHDAAARHGCTINHAFFAAAIGGIGAYHRAMGSDLRQLRVTMPVSFRRAKNVAAGNQWAPVRFVVPADIADPVDRMLAMRTLVVSSRREKALSFSHSLAGLVQVLPSVLSAGVVGGMMHGVDVTLTNVPGLAEPHFLAGAAVERIHAFAPTAGAALNIALVSHLGTGCVGTLSDAAAVADPGLLAASIDEALDEVVAAAERAPATSRRDDSSTPPPAGRRTDRLTALDTGFLRLETPESPMHIGGALVVDGAPLRDQSGRIRIDDIRAHVEARLQGLPRFRRRIAEVPLGLGRPLWVDDEQFDVARHVRVVDAPPPGETQDLLDLCARLYAVPLDRAHPLWDLALVDGLANGRVGIVERVHHALVDGVGGVELAAAIFDLEPADVPDRPDRTVRAVSPPGAPRRLVDAVVEQALDPIAVARSVAGAAWSPRRTIDHVGSAAAAARDLLGPRPPRAPFNRPPGRRRALRAVSLPIADVRAVGAAAGGATLNDVVLVTVAGGLRRWFDAEGIPPIDVHVLVPVSTRVHALGDGPGNQVGAVLVELPVAEPDVRRRLELVHERMLRLKLAHEGEGSARLIEALDHLPAPWYPPLIRLVAGQSVVNAVVTNVPGPPVPLYFLGGRIERIVPVVPLGAQLSLGLAVLSYCDELVISLFADPEAFDDLDELAAGVGAEFDVVRSTIG
jgi:WS/DGAT/MGAT family acyltransferase